MINKEITKITKEDLEELITDCVLENKTLDYKEKPNDLGNQHSKEEFIADVASFANTDGGDIIFGISENEGKPDSLVGFEPVPNIDRFINQMNSILLRNFEPSLFGCQIHPVHIENNNYALVLRIPRSWNQPHGVRQKNILRFHSRGANGKNDMSIDELRNAFNLSQQLVERVEKFRDERINNFISEETPIKLGNNPKLVFHIAPLISFKAGTFFDINRIYNMPNIFRTIVDSGWSRRYILEGLVSYNPLYENKTHSFTILFKNGIIESACDVISNNNEKFIHYKQYEIYIKSLFESHIDLMKELNIELPAIIYLSLIGAKGYRISIDDPYRFMDREKDHYGFDRDIIKIPEVIFDDFSQTTENILKPAFDSMWNSSGYSRSMNYDNDGKWVGR